MMKTLIMMGLLVAGVTRAEVHFTDAGQRGAFNTGDATVNVAPDGRRIDYKITGNAVAGVWSKDYPAPLVNGDADRVAATVSVPGGKPLPGIAMRLEIKGTAGVQAMDVPARGVMREAIDWAVVGKLSEVVLILQRVGGADPAVGSLQLEVTFSTLSPFQKFNLSAPGKMTGVLLVALLSMLLGFIKFKPVGGIARDALLGLATTLLLATVYGVYRFACLPLCFAAAGVAIAALLKLALVGKPLRAGEAFRHALFTGLLALAASKAAVWQAPSALATFGQLSAFGAALFVFIYHAANAYCLSAHKKPIGVIGVIVIAATPFAFGLLFAVQTAGAIWWQAALVLAFAEFIANAASLVTRQKPLRDAKVHIFLVILSVLVVLSPLVADFGSQAMPVWLAPFAAIAATILSQAPLWGLVFLLTALVLDALRGKPPAGPAVHATAVAGAMKGAVFGGVAMGLLQLVALIGRTGLVGTSISFVLVGAIAFPVAKTIIETFDGSQSFFGRTANACKDPVLYARGLIAGLAFAVGLQIEFASMATGMRIGYGAIFGFAAFGGVSLVRDLFYGLKSWRYYLIEGGLGAFIGAGLGFYFDASQLPILTTKFKLYTSFGLDPNTIVTRCQELRTTAPNEFTALISRWGQIKLSPAGGGAKILFNEALMGVIGWGIAAPLFAINKAFLAALINRDASSIKRLTTRDGVVDLVDGTVFVLRWGLWMAPVIFTFLRPMAEATWYNQDGLIRTVFATVNSLTMGSTAFTAWSLTVFSWIIGFSWFQVLIWLDHMGLRVATLVNLSFLGMDKLDTRCATFVGKDATARFIPEGVKRFTTWAPLLIPFYLPKGDQWEQVFRNGSALQSASGTLEPGWLAWGVVFVAATLVCAFRSRKQRRGAGAGEKTLRLANNDYAVELKGSGELNSVCISTG
jgi:cyclic beta-1,2-glucan synthetase